MRKGCVRSTGGMTPGRLTHAACLSRIRRYGERGLNEATRAEIRQLRQQLRDSLQFYRALRRETMTAPEYRKPLERIRTCARRVLAKPAGRRWPKRLAYELERTRLARPGRPVRQRLLKTTGGLALSMLEHDLDTDFQAERHTTTLKLLAATNCQPGGMTRYRDPALPSLLAAVVPIWERIVGRSAWARMVGDDMVSPLYPFLRKILGGEAPTNDQLIRAVRLQKQKK